MNRIVTLPKLPERPIEGHKGMFGRVLVVGGNDQMLGAPVLAGTSALVMGAGLVQIAVPKSILATALSITPELIGLALGTAQADRELLVAAKLADAIVIGPGLGQSSAANSRLMRLIRLDTPVVIDADALNMLAGEKQWPKNFKASAVLTPHPGEMKRLGKLLKKNEVPTDDSGRAELASLAARKFGQVVVLKGNRTVVADAERVCINQTGDSSLSKAGTGDVLSGIIGTLLAQSMDQFDASCAAVWIHGRAGEIAGKKLGLRSVMARDVTDAIPQAIAEYEREI